jgi:hypothetical protein
MQVQTHIMSGWCLGNVPEFTPRERLFCMLAASLPDLDGLTMFASDQAYWDYHHKIAHNFLAGALLIGVLTWFSTHWWKAGLMYVALFHLHLVMDYFGSGPGWGLYYFWPFSSRPIENPHAWEFVSWQNISAAAAGVVWMLMIAVRQRRTPVGALSPKVDAYVVTLFRKVFSSQR